MWKKEGKNKLDLKFRFHMLPVIFICLLNSSLSEVSCFLLTFEKLQVFPLNLRLTRIKTDIWKVSENPKTQIKALPASSHALS